MVLVLLISLVWSGFFVFLNQHSWSRIRRRAALRQRKTDGKKFQIRLTMLFASLCLTRVTVSVQHSSQLKYDSRREMLGISKAFQERWGLVDSYALRSEQRFKQSLLAFCMSQGFHLHPAILVLSLVNFPYLIYLFSFFLARYPVLSWRWWRVSMS